MMLVTFIIEIVCVIEQRMIRKFGCMRYVNLAIHFISGSFFHALLQLFVIIHVLHCSLEKKCRRRVTMACPLNVIIAHYLFPQQGFPHAEYQ